MCIRIQLSSKPNIKDIGKNVQIMPLIKFVLGNIFHKKFQNSGPTICKLNHNFKILVLISNMLNIDTTHTHTKLFGPAIIFKSIKGS